MRNPFSRRREPAPPAMMAAASGAATMSSTMLQSLQQPWQARARMFSKRLGLVQFAHQVTSGVGARCRFVVQQEVSRDQWQEVTGLVDVLDWYQNDHQSFAELMAAHLYRVSVDGDRYEVLDAGSGGRASYWVVPTDKVLWQGQSTAQVYLAPNGNPSDGTALVLDGDRVVRMWTPDADYPLLATSPMQGVIEDCERYWSLMRYVRKTADSRLAMNRILWTPEGAHVPLPQEMQSPGTTPKSELDVGLQQAAKQSFERDDSLQGIMPFILRWDKELGEPKMIDLGRGLEPAVMEALKDAAKWVATGLPLPAQMLLGEGSNHWTDWLLDEQSFRWGVAPAVERVCNDLTRSFLLPTLRVLGLADPSIGDASRFRIWYDSAPVVIHPDRTKDALALNVAGLLAAIPTLEAYGYSAAEMMDEAERAMWAEYRAKVAPGRVPGAPSLPSGTSSPAATDVGVQAGPPMAPAALGSLAPFEAELLDYYRG